MTEQDSIVTYDVENDRYLKVYRDGSWAQIEIIGNIHLHTGAQGNFSKPDPKEGR